MQSRADTAFHVAIAQISKNIVLRQIVSGLSDLLQASITESLAKLYHLSSTIEQLDRQHHLIVDAILAGQPDDARKAAADHLAFVESSLCLIENEDARIRRAPHGGKIIQEEMQS